MISNNLIYVELPSSEESNNVKSTKYSQKYLATSTLIQFEINMTH